MEFSKRDSNKFLTIRIIQSGDKLRVRLTKINLRKKFNEIYAPLLKQLKLKKNYAYLSSKDGKMVSLSDLNLSLEDFVQKFGLNLKLYYERVF